MTGGHTLHPLYKTWKGMIERCTSDRSPSYGNYGARGITVCRKWMEDPHSFYGWAASAGWTPGLKLDRADNDGNYTPTNCRWVTAKVNSNNRRDNRYLSHEGETMTATQWAERFGMTRNAVLNRIDRGWSVAKALTTPRRNYPLARTRS